jgi:hypothetical protein
VYAGPTPAGGLGRVAAEMTVRKKASTAALESFSQRLFHATTPRATQPVLSVKFFITKFRIELSGSEDLCSNEAAERMGVQL